MIVILIIIFLIVAIYVSLNDNKNAVDVSSKNSIDIDPTEIVDNINKTELSAAKKPAINNASNYDDKTEIVDNIDKTELSAAKKPAINNASNYDDKLGKTIIIPINSSKSGYSRRSNYSDYGYDSFGTNSYGRYADSSYREDVGGSRKTKY